MGVFIPFLCLGPYVWDHLQRHGSLSYVKDHLQQVGRNDRRDIGRQWESLSLFPYVWGSAALVFKRSDGSMAFTVDDPRYSIRYPESNRLHIPMGTLGSQAWPPNRSKHLASWIIIMAGPSRLASTSHALGPVQLCGGGLCLTWLKTMSFLPMV